MPSRSFCTVFALAFASLAIAPPAFSETPKRSRWSPLLAEGRRWVSEDSTFALHFPKNWDVRDLPFAAAAQLPGSRAFVSARMEHASREPTAKEQLRALEIEAARNAPPLMGSSGMKQLGPTTVTVAGLPAAWSGLAFTDKNFGPMVSLAYAIGAPKATYIIMFGLVPRGQFDKLRPVFEAIVNSLELLR